MLEGWGRFAGHEDSTYAYCGSLSPNEGFRGSFLCRAMDPEGTLRSERNLPKLAQILDPEPGITYIVLKGEKPASNRRTKYKFSADGQVTGLRVEQQLRVFNVDCAARGHGGLRTTKQTQQIVGKMISEISFNLFNPGAPGTAEAPIPFSAYNYFTLFDQQGRTVGGFEGDGGEGRTFTMGLPSAPGQQALRFAGVGPVKNGSGIFRDITGMMSDNSVVGIAPHATSTFYVLRLNDPTGKYRALVSDAGGVSVGGGAPAGPSAPAAEQKMQDVFKPLVENTESYTEHYISWREGFKRRSREFAPFIAAEFNRLLDKGDFPGLAIDADQLAASFEAEIGSFDAERFERYRGTAKGTFKTYDLSSDKKIFESVLYSDWDSATYVVNGRHCKQITGSNDRYYLAGEPLPSHDEGKVDLLVNSFREDVGVISWVSIFQGNRGERTSIAYSLPHDHEVLWMVKDIVRDGQAVDEDIFMASHEWKGHVDGKTYYYMVGIFFEVDFETGHIAVSGDIFWKALYEEEDA